MKVIGKNVNRYLVACRVTDDLSPDFEKFRHVNFNRTRYEKNGRVQSKREPQAFFLSLLLTFFVFITTVFAAKDGKPRTLHRGDETISKNNSRFSFFSANVSYNRSSGRSGLFAV